MAKHTQASKTAITEQGGINAKLPLSLTLSKELLEDLYITQKKSLGDIAAIFGCTRQNIFYILKANGITRRTKSKARVEAIRQGKFKSRFKVININEDFFSSWSHEMAWVLGLIWTDGCLQEIPSGNGGHVVLSSIDKELLEKVNRAMDSNGPIYVRKQSYDPTKEIFSIAIYREKMRNNLKQLGLTARKSVTLQLPSVPQEFFGSFLRGCWDGDGSFYKARFGRLGRYERVEAEYVCGSKDFMLALAQALYGYGIHARRKNEYNGHDLLRFYKNKKQENLVICGTETQSVGDSFYFKLSGENLYRLCQLLYTGAPDDLCLKRKRDIAESYMADYKRRHEAKGKVKRAHHLT